MRAVEVMTTNVITIGPDASLQELALLLCQHAISGVPVVEGDRILGIVTEGDLLHRTETGTEHRTEKRRARWLDSFASDEELARNYVKSHSRFVRDIMTRDVVTVTDATDLAEIANLLEAKRIKRVPVLRECKLVGIISRANLVRALAMSKDRAPEERDYEDGAIRRKLLQELQGQEWARLWAADVTIRDQIVHIWCSDDQSPEELRAIRVAAENTPGVRGVEQHVVTSPAIPAF